MELYERKIINASPCSIGHRQSISRGDAGVRGLLPKPPYTSGGQDDRIRFQRDHLVAELVQTPNASDAPGRVAVHSLNEVNGEGVGSQFNALMSFSVSR